MSSGSGAGAERPFTAIILAADREAHNPVAAAAGVACKALAPVAGTPMVVRVLRALAESGEVERMVLCGPPWAIVEANRPLAAALARFDAGWLEPRATPSLSAHHALASLPAQTPVRPTPMSPRRGFWCSSDWRRCATCPTSSRWKMPDC